MPTGLLSELEFYLTGNYDIREEKKKIKKIIGDLLKNSKYKSKIKKYSIETEQNKIKIKFHHYDRHNKEIRFQMGFFLIDVKKRIEEFYNKENVNFIEIYDWVSEF